MQTVGLAKRTRREHSSTVSDGDDVVITGQNEKDNEQQRRKSPRTTEGKGTRKIYADDTVVQEQLAKTSTKGNRESIQSETTTREVSGRDMDNDEVLFRNNEPVFCSQLHFYQFSYLLRSFCAAAGKVSLPARFHLLARFMDNFYKLYK